MKFNQKIKAIQLRKGGKSYGEIKNILNVSKGTLSSWLKNIKLTPEQKKKIYISRQQKNAYRLAKKNQQIKIEKTKKIIEGARREIKKYLKNNLFIAGLMLYWAEGDKSDKTEIVKFTNSDPEMIKLIMNWFRQVCNVPNEKFRIALHIHELHCRKNLEEYWSQLTKIPLKQFHKTQIKPTSLRQRRNTLYNGTCAVRISSKDLFRKIKGWKLGVLEKINKKY